jgi:cation diffusion facilitator CzcD-associated flavoprotein CzcO
MRIIHGTDSFPASARGAALAIGNFDGVHRGHQALIKATRDEAVRLGAQTGAVVFEPHPREYFQPDKPHFRLTPLPLKLRLLERFGVEVVGKDRPMPSATGQGDGRDITILSFGMGSAMAATTMDLLSAVKAYLGPDYDIATHFTPRYRPWRQRIAFIPDGDLFQGIKSGKASVVTDEIDRFTEKGILLKSGKELEADIIITATGFHLSANGDIEFAVDGKKLDFADTVTYRGMMFTGVPNLVWVF